MLLNLILLIFWFITSCWDALVVFGSELHVSHGYDVSVEDLCGQPENLFGVIQMLLLVRKTDEGSSTAIFWQRCLIALFMLAIYIRFHGQWRIRVPR